LTKICMRNSRHHAHVARLMAKDGAKNGDHPREMTKKRNNYGKETTSDN
jgi:hypothetical protein